MMRLELLTFILLVYVISEINLFASSLGNCTNCNHKNDTRHRITDNSRTNIEASNSRLKRLGHELLDELYRAPNESKASLVDDESGRTIYSSLMKILHSMKVQQAREFDLSKDTNYHHISAEDLSISPTNLVVQHVKSSHQIPLQTVNGEKRSDERLRDENDSILFGNKLNGSTNGPQNVNNYDDQQTKQAKQASAQNSLVIEVSNNEPILQHPHFEDTVNPIGVEPPDKHRDLPNRSLKFTHRDAQLNPFGAPSEHSLFTMSSELGDPDQSYSTASRLVESDGDEQVVELQRNNKQHQSLRPVASNSFQTSNGQSPSSTVYETTMGTRKRSQRPTPASFQRLVSVQSTRRPTLHVLQSTSGYQQPKYAVKTVRYNDYISSSSGDSNENDELSEPERRPLRSIDYDTNNPYPQPTLQSHRGIILQQINPSAPLSSSQPVSFQSGSSVQQNPLNSVYNLRSGSSSGLKFLTKNDLASNGQLLGAQSWTQQQQVTQDMPTNRQYPGDLQNQPQTIQVTALPYGGLNQLVRFQTPWTNTLNGLGPNYGFSTDAFGRPVLMLNAERRQVDWPAWFYPMILIVTLPLILGALFVPLFLKTIIVLLQMLQSLGLLLPMTNAMSQQILQATGLTNGTTLAHFELPKT